MKKKPSRPDGYHSWQGMIGRCEYPHHPDYRNYGGRGISVCPRWRKSFKDFMADMGPRPTKRHTIERIDTNGNYEPANCRWATQKEQQNNRRNNRLLTLNGETLTMAQWAERIGITIYALYQRLERGKMRIEEALQPRDLFVEYTGERLTITDWATRLGIKRSTIVKRLKRGWTVEKTLTAPVRDWGR